MVAEMTSKIRRVPEYVADSALAVGLAAFGCFTMAARPFEHHGKGPRPPFPPDAGEGTFTNPFGRFGPATPLAYALTLIAFLPLAFRRRLPLTVLAVTSVAGALWQLGHYPPNLVFLAPLIALYTVASLRERPVALVAGVASAVVQLIALWLSVSNTVFWGEMVRTIAFVGVAGAFGDATRNRRAYIAEMEQRTAEAERTREEEARARVDEERLRIARELHDITAHSLSIIAVQSGAAAHVIDSNPAEARTALEAIRRTSKDALDELRAMLGVLRAAGDTDAPLAPAPGLGRLGDLVAPLTQAGYEVKSDIGPDLGEIPAVVEGSAYRIIQESLTNVVRHAGVCRVNLEIHRREGALEVLVEDDGRTPEWPLPEGGHGLAGMRERVNALGGTFDASPRDAGGFVVRARLPITRSAER
jgi:signal transduction histidine kinase